MSSKEWALQLITDFSKRSGKGFWPLVDRGELANSLTARVNDPNLIYQSNTNLCGPTAFVRDWAIDDPADYAWAGIELFEKGIAHIGRGSKFGKILKPSADLRMSVLPKFVVSNQNLPMDPADWVILGSIRDSYNHFFNYMADEEAHIGPFSVNRGVSLAGTVADMFKAAGYTEVKDYTVSTLVVPGVNACNINHARIAGKYYLANYKVVMFINGNMLDQKTQDSRGFISKPNHFIGLVSDVLITAENHVVFDAFTYGQVRRVPLDTDSPWDKALSVDDFLKNYYGFIAAKY
jgi:hypothetical protein